VSRLKATYFVKMYLQFVLGCREVPKTSMVLTYFAELYGAKLYVHCGIHIFILRGMTKYT
jgi:hypothetical protein